MTDDYVVLADSLRAEQPPTFDNLFHLPPKPGEDYYGGPIKIAGIAYADALPTQPADAKRPAVIRVPLAGLDGDGSKIEVTTTEACDGKTTRSETARVSAVAKWRPPVRRPGASRLRLLAERAKSAKR